jgi:hypothetical protein
MKKRPSGNIYIKKEESIRDPNDIRIAVAKSYIFSVLK